MNQDHQHSTGCSPLLWFWQPWWSAIYLSIAAASGAYPSSKLQSCSTPGLECDHQGIPPFFLENESIWVVQIFHGTNAVAMSATEWLDFRRYWSQGPEKFIDIKYLLTTISHIVEASSRFKSYKAQMKIFASLNFRIYFSLVKSVSIRQAAQKSILRLTYCRQHILLQLQEYHMTLMTLWYRAFAEEKSWQWRCLWIWKLHL